MNARGGGRRTLAVAALLVAVVTAGVLVSLDRGGLERLGLASLREGAEVPADSAGEARAMVADCGNLGVQQKTDCYRAQLSRRLAEAGVRPAMSTLDYLVLLDKDVSRDAHTYAHHIGIEAYRLWPDVSGTFVMCTESFSSGCYHGVIQAYFQDRGTPDQEIVDALCEPYKSGDQSRWILFQCVHGMGHGLTMYYGHHLPMALEACDLLQDNWDRQSCYGGAFMENIMAATSPHHPASLLHDSVMSRGAAPGSRGAATASEWKALDPTDPLYPCSVMEQRYLVQCYLMQTSAMLYLSGGDLADASYWCDRAPEAFRRTCHQSLGRSVTARTRDPKRAERLCRSGSERYRGWCYVGVVKAFVDWTSSADSGLEFCRVVEDVGHKSMCYKALGEEIATLVADAETQASLCARAEEEHIGDCRRGARLRG